MEACYADRQSPEHRQIWFESIEEFNAPDRTKMAREMLAQRPVYNGTLAEFHRKGDALMKIMGIPQITSQPRQQEHSFPCHQMASHRLALSAQ